jgi:hypothetical protein
MTAAAVVQRRSRMVYVVNKYLKDTQGNICKGAFPTLADAKQHVEALHRNKSIDWRDSGSRISEADFSTIKYQIIGYDSLDTAKQWHELDDEMGRVETEMEMLAERD